MSLKKVLWPQDRNYILWWTILRTTKPYVYWRNLINSSHFEFEVKNHKYHKITSLILYTNDIMKTIILIVLDINVLEMQWSSIEYWTAILLENEWISFAYRATSQLGAGAVDSSWNIVFWYRSFYTVIENLIPRNNKHWIVDFLRFAAEDKLRSFLFLLCQFLGKLFN